MDIDYSKYEFKIRCLYENDKKEIGQISFTFLFTQKLIKSYESVLVGNNWYTQITFSDDSTVISDKPYKRFKQEVMPKYYELLNEYLNLPED